MNEENLQVLFLSPEVFPFAKSGGLADMAGSLPSALKRLGIDVRLVLPFYRSVKEGKFDTRPILKKLSVPIGQEWLRADVHETLLEPDIPVYLIEREDLFDRPNLYGNPGGDYYDNLERFSFYSHAALNLTAALPFKPDVIHCHDWQTGLVPPLIRGPYRFTPTLSGTATVFTIHNLGYQGLFPQEKFSLTGLPQSDFCHPEGLEYWGNVSLLKGGIVYSDAVTTVSPTYAREIQTPEYGLGMDGVLRRRSASLHGILNGVDYDVWAPERDQQIAVEYSPDNREGKMLCKELLIEKMGLDPALKTKPLLGMISRLDKQKGLDLLIQILDELFRLDVGLVILGSGEEQIQNTIREAASRHVGRLGLYVGFNNRLAHEIVAGADMFLIPSRYEPCGLTQMYALKYGTVPIVRATGGLEDTVIPYDGKTKRGNGFKFGPYEAEALLETLREAVDLFTDSASWQTLMDNGMKEDLSWHRSARSYLDLYQSLAG